MGKIGLKALKYVISYFLFFSSRTVQRQQSKERKAYTHACYSVLFLKNCSVYTGRGAKKEKLYVILVTARTSIIFYVSQV
jgi:hypothetical protein